MIGALYVVATPIGNLSDITNRMKETFEFVDFIAAEDTRVSVKLLNHLAIKKPMISYHEHNLKEKGEYIINRILKGENCAVCSDAGTPCISDPGEILVMQAHEKGIRVIPIPGASAAIAALSVSGQSTKRFCFEGFVSTAKNKRKEHLQSLENETRTMIFYEAPHKLLNTLKDFNKYFGEERKLTIAREITKLNEEVVIFTLKEALDYYSQKPKILGEFVLVLEGAKEKEKQEGKPLDELALDCYKLSINDKIPLSKAAKIVCENTKFSKSEVYKMATQIKDERG